MTASSDAYSLPVRALNDATKPKHAQLREILEEYCTSTLQAGDMLPGERILEDHFGVSRITVRRAIGDLVASGVLKRARGKGTFVAPSPLVSRLHLASFSQEMEAQQLASSSKILLSARACAPEEVCVFFGSEPSRFHTHLRRLRLGNGLPYAIDDAWYNSAYVPDLLENDVYNSVYAILGTEYGVPITDAIQTATAVAADEECAALLDVTPGTALLKIVRQSQSNGRPVECCSSLYRTDRYTLKTQVTRA
ncbi:GntR family transcriptional regulator [Corynebacterium epidermidicanis]|uniref:Transcriptional regulator n=1 Tax=Corynebacterium epidermidicanis TaxID=1050174 RepID=A0A0G3GZE2_9CORY|nr:GntR family transcriptional regulator [Corynebacterium epidermidicanis]AKK04172.1 transcriptional regulator [Corynebacterium epidermidicanis]